MAEFPNAVKNFLALQDGVDRVIAAHPNDRGGEITAIETFLGALGTTQPYNTTLKYLLSNYRRGCEVEYKGDADFYVRGGEIVIPDPDNPGDVVLRISIPDIIVDWDALDTGSEENSTLYYVYAVANSGVNFAIQISKSDSAPVGWDFYRKLGNFYNNASGHIDAIESNDVDVSSRQILKGWINFDGTNAASITDSENVTSLTDNGVGDFLVTWDTDFANAKYTITTAVQTDGIIGIGTVLAASIQILTYSHGGDPSDRDPCDVMAVGDL